MGFGEHLATLKRKRGTFVTSPSKKPVLASHFLLKLQHDSKCSVEPPPLSPQEIKEQKELSKRLLLLWTIIVLDWEIYECMRWLDRSRGIFRCTWKHVNSRTELHEVDAYIGWSEFKGTLDGKKVCNIKHGFKASLRQKQELVKLETVKGAGYEDWQFIAFRRNDDPPIAEDVRSASHNQSNLDMLLSTTPETQDFAQFVEFGSNYIYGKVDVNSSSEENQSPPPMVSSQNAENVDTGDPIYPYGTTDFNLPAEMSLFDAGTSLNRTPALQTPGDFNNSHGFDLNSVNELVDQVLNFNFPEEDQSLSFMDASHDSINKNIFPCINTTNCNTPVNLYQSDSEASLDDSSLAHGAYQVCSNAGGLDSNSMVKSIYEDVNIHYPHGDQSFKGVRHNIESMTGHIFPCSMTNYNTSAIAHKSENTCSQIPNTSAKLYQHRTDVSWDVSQRPHSQQDFNNDIEYGSNSVIRSPYRNVSGSFPGQNQSSPLMHSNPNILHFSSLNYSTPVGFYRLNSDQQFLQASVDLDFRFGGESRQD